jgi:transcription factor E
MQINPKEKEGGAGMGEEEISYVQGRKINVKKVVAAFENLKGLTEEEFEEIVDMYRHYFKKRNKEITRNLESKADEIFNQTLEYYKNLI